MKMTLDRLFNKHGKLIIVVLASLFVIAVVFGVYFAFFASPIDYQQGNSVRIMYVHVPSAWMSLLIYAIMAAAAVSQFVWKNPFSFLIAKNSAIIGATFTLLALITGSIWAKPMWGTWWVWDARLTSMLILFFMYVGYIVLCDMQQNNRSIEKLSSIVIIAGSINIPIIKFSVNLWNTMHQPASIVRSGGIAIDKSFLPPLFIMFFSFLCYYIGVLFIKIRSDILERKVLSLLIRGRK